MASYLGDFIESPGKRYFNFLLCHFQGWLLLLIQYGYQSCSHHICIPGSRTEEVQRKAISSWILLSSCIQCPYFYIIGPKLVTWSCISLNGGQYAQLKVRIVITKEIGENGFTEINNTYFHVVILFVCGGGALLDGSQKVIDMKMALAGILFSPYLLKAQPSLFPALFPNSSL